MFRGTQVPAGANARISPTGLSPPVVTLSFVFGYPCDVRTVAGPTTPGDALPHPRFGLLRVRSPLLAQSLLFSFPAGTEMFQFPAFAPAPGAGVGIASHGFPHSDICGSICICHSPQLFAAYHVLRRLREPQASPMRPCSLSLYLSPSVKPLLQLLDSRFVKSLESVFRILLFASRFHHVNDLSYRWRITDSNR